MSLINSVVQNWEFDLGEIRPLQHSHLKKQTGRVKRRMDELEDRSRRSVKKEEPGRSLLGANQISLTPSTESHYTLIGNLGFLTIITSLLISK